MLDRAADASGGALLSLWAGPNARSSCVSTPAASVFWLENLLSRSTMLIWVPPQMPLRSLSLTVLWLMSWSAVVFTCTPAIVCSCSSYLS